MEPTNTITEAVAVEAVLEVFEDIQKEEVVDVVIEKTLDGKITETTVTTITETVTKDIASAIEDYDAEIANLDEGIANNQAQIAHLEAIRQKYVDKKANASK